MADDDLVCPSCGLQNFDVGVFPEHPASFIIECTCGWTVEGEGTYWQGALVVYEGDSTDGEEGESGPREGWPLTPDADGPGEPPGW